MNESVLDRIHEMGQDQQVSLKDLEDYVNSCIQFLKMIQDTSPELDLANDIFEIEAARQDALINKYSRTVQKP